MLLASPSLCACRATASATVTATSRSAVTGGSRLCVRVVARRRQRGQRLGGRHEHAVGHPAAPDRDHAEPDAREDVGVVGLVDLERCAVAHDRRKRAAGADHRAAVGPGLDSLPASPRARGRIREREDHRPLDCFGHRAHDRLGEGAGLARDADQHRRLGVVARRRAARSCRGWLELSSLRSPLAAARTAAGTVRARVMPSTSSPSRSTMIEARRRPRFRQPGLDHRGAAAGRRCRSRPSRRRARRCAAR